MIVLDTYLQFSIIRHIPTYLQTTNHIHSKFKPCKQTILPGRVLAMPPPDPVQPPGQDELERRLPGYRRIVIPRELTLIELLVSSGCCMHDEEGKCDLLRNVCSACRPTL